MCSSLAGRASVILERVTGQLEPVFLTQALWALATLGLHSQELGLRAATVRAHFNKRVLVLSRPYNKVANRSPASLSESQVLEKRVSELSTGEVANLAWALAKVLSHSSTTHLSMPISHASPRAPGL